MEKKLPKVFVNKIDKEFRNNDKVFYEKSGEKEEQKETRKDIITRQITIPQKINQIFGSSRYVYKADVDITLKDGKVSEKVVARNKHELITLDNKLIKIDDIVDIEFSE